MREIEYLKAAEQFAKTPPGNFKESIRVASDTLKRLGFTQSFEIFVVPDSRVAEEDALSRIEINGIVRDLDAKGLGFASQNTVAVRTSSQGVILYASFDRFAESFLVSQKDEPKTASVGAIALFTTVAEELYDNCAREIKLPYSERVVSGLISETVQIASKIAQEHQELELSAYPQELQKKLESENLTLVGKGAEVQLRLGNLVYLFASHDQQVLALRILREKAVNEFFKQMKKACDWFVPPQHWTQDLQNLYAARLGPSPEISELSVNKNGVIIGLSRLGISFLSSELARLNFDAMVGESLEAMASKLRSAFSGELENQGQPSNTTTISVREYTVLPMTKSSRIDSDIEHDYEHDYKTFERIKPKKRAET